jgi:hypothetical protein
MAIESKENTDRKREENSRNELADEIAKYADLADMTPEEALVEGIFRAVRSTVLPSKRMVEMPTPMDFKKHNLERERNLKNKEKKESNQTQE